MAMSQKHFRKRDAILSYLRSTKAHPSAEIIFTQLKPQIPDLSMGTVYRNLNLFKAQGLATSVATVDGVERFDGNTDPHVHFICHDCGTVFDLDGMHLPTALSETACQSCGAEVTGCQLSFTGRCRSCLGKTCSA